MKLQPKDHEEPEVNLTSLIDVVLLLLIFFMVSTTFIDESRIRLQLPQASTEPAMEQKKDPIEVAVTASGEFRVNGQVLINTSPSTLSAAVSKIAGERRDLPITIRADARATHQSVVTAMDVLGRLGLEEVHLPVRRHQRPPSAVPAARSALGPVGLSLEGHSPFTTMPRAGVDLHLINKHPWKFKHTRPQMAICSGTCLPSGGYPLFSLP